MFSKASVQATFFLLVFMYAHAEPRMADNPLIKQLVQCQERIMVADGLPEVQGEDYEAPETETPRLRPGEHTANPTALDMIRRDTNLVPRPSDSQYHAFLGEQFGETGVWFYTQNQAVFQPIDTTLATSYDLSNQCDELFGDSNPEVLAGELDNMFEAQPEIFTAPNTAVILHACNAYANTDQALGNNPLFVNGRIGDRDVAVGVRTDGVGDRRNSVLKVDPDFPRNGVNELLYRVSNDQGMAEATEEFYKGLTDRIVHRLNEIDADHRSRGFEAWNTVRFAALQSAVANCAREFRGEPGYEAFAKSMKEHRDRIFSQTPTNRVPISSDGDTSTETGSQQN